jgi:hypothetical protein
MNFTRPVISIRGLVLAALNDESYGAAFSE